MTFERHSDGLGGIRYDEQFGPDELGRSGGDIINVHNDDDHMDVIEYHPDHGKEHHRINGKPGENIRDFLDG